MGTASRLITSNAEPHVVPACLLAPPRIGRVLVRQGRFQSLDPLWISRRKSLLQVWWHKRHRNAVCDKFELYYTATRRSQGFITVDFIYSGQAAGLSSLFGALAVLDVIAQSREALAIVAHVGNRRISPRLLRRCGWEPHAANLGENHWIKRFYAGYPPVNLQAYCD